MPDDCRELTVLRTFRDEYLAKKPKGYEEIEEYYKTAPKIVKMINSKSNKEKIYEKLYDDVIEPCVELIENGKNEEAYVRYKKMVKDLEKTYM